MHALYDRIIKNTLNFHKNFDFIIIIAVHNSQYACYNSFKYLMHFIREQPFWRYNSCREGTSRAHKNKQLPFIEDSPAMHASGRDTGKVQRFLELVVLYLGCKQGRLPLWF